jgi:hypothetical protein
MLSRAIDCSGGQQISGKSIGAAYPACPGSTERRTRDLKRCCMTLFGAVDSFTRVLLTIAPVETARYWTDSSVASSWRSRRPATPPPDSPAKNPVSGLHRPPIRS